MEKTSTIYQVAEIAGVSPATVSRVINKRAGVNTQTVQRVERALEEARFRPRWKAAPVNAVGIVVMPHFNCLAYPYNAHILSAACETLFAEGYVVQLIPCERTQEALSGIRHLMTSHQIAGTLVMTAHPLGDIAERIECEGIPHVAVGPVPAGLSVHHVSVDDFAGGDLALRYLWGLGHRRFGVVTASTRDSGHRLRLDGMRHALGELGGDAHSLLHREFPDVDPVWGESAASELLLGPARPTALIVTNSILALGVARGCRRLGLAVPGHVSLLGFEDAEELAGVDPPMTVMRQPSRRLGEQAAHLLLSQIRGEALPDPDLLSLTLMVRDSTAAPA